MVGVVCTMIFIYASSYMHGEFKAYTDLRSGEVDEAIGHARYGRFFAYVSLFATGMLGFVLASNLLQALIFWEIMGLCSFLLIGFWNYKPEAAEAAKKAFLTTRIGDLFLFSGIMVLWAVIGSVDYFGENGMLTESGLQKLVELGTIPHTSIPYATVIALLVFGGAGRQERTVPAARLAPGRHGGPDARLRDDPRGHDGLGRRLPRGADVPGLLRQLRRVGLPCDGVRRPREPHHERDGRGCHHRRDHGPRRGAHRRGPERHQARASPTPRSASSAT